MDFFKSAFASAQEQATKAAAEAKVLAERAQVVARQQAEEVSKAARQQAEEASKRFQGLQGDMRKLDLSVVKDSVSKAFASGNDGGVSPQELLDYGVTEEFVNHVRGFTYMTFRDFPEERLTVTRGISADSMANSVKLGSWQQQHAMLLIQAIPDFNDLRYVLCPGKMPEERFWEIYFAMVKNYLPPQAQEFQTMGSSTGGSKDAGRRAEAVGGNVQPSWGAFTLDHDEEQAGEDDGGYQGEEGEDEGWEEGGLEELIGEEGTSGAEAVVERVAATSGSMVEETLSTPTRSAVEQTAASTDNAWLPSTPEPTVSAADVDSLVDTPGTKESSEEELDDDFDAYVEGMLGGGGFDEDGEGGNDADEGDDDDFDEYMNELARGTEVGEPDEKDVTLGSDDLDFGELDDGEEDDS